MKPRGVRDVGEMPHPLGHFWDRPPQPCPRCRVPGRKGLVTQPVIRDLAWAWRRAEPSAPQSVTKEESGGQSDGRASAGPCPGSLSVCSWVG